MNVATDNTRQPNEHECPPRPKNPALQPSAPDKECKKPTDTNPPTLDEPKKCPEPKCECPPKPTSDSNCLDQMIADQTKEITKGDKAKAFKADLEALLGKAKTASQDYTRPNYDKLLKRWLEQDAAIAELVRKLVCALPCWRCVIECYLCPLLNELHYAEERLYADSKLTQVGNLYDLHYWHTRNRDAKERALTHIKNILAAWEKPFATIEKALNDNQGLIDGASKVIGTDPGKAVYDVFLKLVPMHLAIAPPKTDDTTTRISVEYTDFCECDKGSDEKCCGIYVGKRTLRDRLIGPQPYLIDPNDYFNIICCLVEHRYVPAKDQFATAEAEWGKVDNDIKKYKGQLENWTKAFETTAKAAIPSPVDCCDHESKEQPGTTGQTGS